MAVVEMGKLNLVAMSYEKDKVLNALGRTGATEIKLHSQTEYAAPMTADCDSLKEYLSGLEDALSKITDSVKEYVSQHKLKVELPKDGCEITYSEFIGAMELKAEADETVQEVNRLLDEQKKYSSELAKVKRMLADAEIYASVEQPLKVENTAHARFKVGTIPAPAKVNFVQAMGELPLASYSFVSSSKDSELIMVAAHKSEAENTDAVLQSFGFVKCPFDDGRTGAEIYNSFKQREEELKTALDENQTQLYALKDRIDNLRIYCDFVAFELEKAELSEKMLATETTFLLEAYVPVEAEEGVRQALAEVSSAVYFEFSEPSEDEIPPTLLRNNKIVKNFEAVTNMYSAPSSREFDPNTVMAFFYSLFLGFIMGDVIYGLLMIVIGGYIWFSSKRESGMKNIAGVFAIGGIFAVFWGFLFNSFLGMNVLPFTVMPDAQGGRYSLAGIKIPSVLVISMLIGMVQLCAGYVCRAVQCWRRGEIADGIFEGLTWAVFMVGAMLAVVGFVEEFHLSMLATVGGIIVGASLLLAMLTAGRKEKIIGKFTKGFGAAYGVINIVSDILSYARLYGLMLSGAVIAQIVSGFVVTGYNGSTPFLFSGNVGLIILGVVLMFVGHAFNLAIGLLGAYIHDARLQYVEFYGRFFEGEGSIFTPLGSNLKHTYLVLNK